MNHTNIVDKMASRIADMKALEHLGLPYVLAEANSIGAQGVNGITNVFGSALWQVDQALYAASQVFGPRSLYLLPSR